MKEKFERFKNEKTIINVRSQKQYDDFMKMCEKQGLKWNSGDLPTENNYYNDYEEETCINLNNLKEVSYSVTDFYKYEGYEIITYEDFMKEESNQFTKSDLKDNHIVVLRNNTKILYSKDTEDGFKKLIKHDLTHSYGAYLDIMEVYEFDKLVWKREKQILDEVEIIEEDKPIEKLMRLDSRETSDCIIKTQDKINEIIDKVNKLKKEKE